MSEATETPVNHVSKNVILMRHIIGVSVLLLFQSPSAYAVDGIFMAWLGAAIMVFGAAAIITGLAWVFLTNKQSGKVSSTFAITSWVLAFLVLAGQNIK